MKTTEPVTYKRVSSIKPKVKLKIPPAQIAAAIIGMFISGGDILGTMSPLGLAWCGALKGGLPVIAGCMLGSLLIDMGIMRLKYFFAIGAYGLIRSFYQTKRWESVEFSVGVMCTVSFVFSCIAMMIRGFLYYDFAVGILECAVIWAAGVIFAKGGRVIERKGQVISDEESIAVAIALGAAALGLQGIVMLGIRPANILSMYIILFTAYKGGIGISGAVGAALGIITAMSQGDAAALTGVYAFVGLTAGIMNMFGKVGVMLAAICANAVFSAYYSSSVLVMINVFEIIIAGIAFYFTPDGVLDYIEKYAIKSEGYNPSKGQLIYERIKTAHAFETLKNALRGTAKAFESKEEENEDEKIAVICDRVAARVCDKCSLGKYCWSKNIKNTSALFSGVAKSLKNGGENLAETVSGKCVRGEMLAKAASELFEVYKKEKAAERSDAEYTDCITSQWDKLANHVEEIENGLRPWEMRDDVLSENLNRGLSLSGINGIACEVRKNKMGIYTATVKTKKIIKRDISDTVSEIISKTMIIKEERQEEDGWVLILTEDTYFDYDIATVSMDKPGTEISGDCGKHFLNKDGALCCVISDGMGSGRQAADESSEITDIFEKLTAGGFSFEDAAEIINMGLLGKGRKESCITLDCLKINLYNGKVEMLKAGAAATVMKDGKKTRLIRNTTMPLGILNDMKGRKTEFAEIEGETYFVMMTDGIPDNCGDRVRGENWVKTVVEASGDVSAKELADSVIMSAVTMGKPKDDMMVTAVKIFPKKVYKV